MRDWLVKRRCLWKGNRLFQQEKQFTVVRQIELSIAVKVKVKVVVVVIAVIIIVAITITVIIIWLLLVSQCSQCFKDLLEEFYQQLVSSVLVVATYLNQHY